MNSRQRYAVAIAGLVWTSVALAQPAAELELPSCVSGSPPLRVSSAAQQARLDAADRQCPGMTASVLGELNKPTHCRRP